MYLRIDDELYKKIQNITGFDYERIGDFIPAENIECIIKDLLAEINYLEEKYENLEQDIEDNYKRRTPEEDYGIDDRDFM